MALVLGEKTRVNSGQWTVNGQQGTNNAITKKSRITDNG